VVILIPLSFVDKQSSNACPDHVTGNINGAKFWFVASDDDTRFRRLLEDPDHLACSHRLSTVDLVFSVEPGELSYSSSLFRFIMQQKM